MKQINRDLLSLLRLHGIVPADDLTFKNNTSPIEQSQKIHSLYEDLYLTDLKNDLGDAAETLQQEKLVACHLQHQVKQLNQKLAFANRTIANYRQSIVELQSQIEGSKLKSKV